VVRTANRYIDRGGLGWGSDVCLGNFDLNIVENDFSICYST
jgi:hypothetical protein